MRTLALALIFCTGLAPSGQDAASRPIRIVTTVFPLAEFARSVAGSEGDVSLILPPGAEIHTWQPRMSDLLRIADADLFVYIGQGLEAWADDLLKSVARPGLKVLESAHGLPLMTADPEEARHEGEGFDPHIWLDLGMDEVLIDRIAAALTDIDARRAGAFGKNAAAYKARLHELDRSFQEGLKTCGQRAFIFGGHAAFGYLARRYQLEQISLYGPSPDAAPTPKELARVMDRARTLGVTTVFFERSVGDRLARLVASPLKAEVLPLNPGHNVTRAEVEAGLTFLDLMRTNLENFRHGLHCR
jgi:zinc transport system substrate-binding protein